MSNRNRVPYPSGWGGPYGGQMTMDGGGAHAGRPGGSGFMVPRAMAPVVQSRSSAHMSQDLMARDSFIPCCYCRERVPQKFLKYHILEKHAPLEFYCKVCNTSFTKYKNLRAHALEEHLEAIHTLVITKKLTDEPDLLGYEESDDSTQVDLIKTRRRDIVPMNMFAAQGPFGFVQGPMGALPVSYPMGPMGYQMMMANPQQQQQNPFASLHGPEGPMFPEIPQPPPDPNFDPSQLTQIQREKIVRFCSVYPCDLRALDCRFCGRIYLGQDRAELASHIDHKHGYRLSTSELSYSCRLCDKKFKSTDRFLEHHCCRLNRQCLALPPPLIPDLPTGPSASRKAIEAGNGLSEESNADLYDCQFCLHKVSQTERAGHRAKHSKLEFQCNLCPRSYVEIDEMKSHAVQDHSLEIPENVLEMVNKESGNAFSLPRDLRKLKCPICNLEILGQSRNGLAKHLTKLHRNEMKLYSSEEEVLQYVSYICRICEKDEFKSTRDIDDHDCAKIISFKKDKEIADTIPVKLDDVFDIIRLKREEVQEKMKENEEDKKDVAEGEKGEDISSSGLGTINADQIEQENVSTQKRASSTRPKEEEESNPGENSTEVDVKKEIEPSKKRRKLMDNSEEKETVQRLLPDVRVLACKFCEHTEVGKGFAYMIMHLEKVHKRYQLSRTERLDEYVWLLCGLCRGDFRAPDVHQWDGHFIDNYKSCSKSVKEENKSSASNDGEDSSSMEREIKAVAEEDEDDNFVEDAESEDCRKLTCSLCGAERNKSKFHTMEKHFNSKHEGIDVKNLDDLVVFGCFNCPDLTESLVGAGGKRKAKFLRWDAHFTKDYLSCKAVEAEREKKGQTAAAAASKAVMRTGLDAVLDKIDSLNAERRMDESSS